MEFVLILSIKEFPDGDVCERPLLAIDLPYISKDASKFWNPAIPNKKNKDETIKQCLMKRGIELGYL
tara:strand:- start:112 stop:312 length:201 start_codon:yes stop_codon:yes gene_type:complete